MGCVAKECKSRSTCKGYDKKSGGSDGIGVKNREEKI